MIMLGEMKSRFNTKGPGCEWDEIEWVWGEKFQMRLNFDEGEKSVFRK